MRAASCLSGRTWLLLLAWLWLLAGSAAAAEYEQLPSTPAPGLSTDWLLHDATRRQLTLYLPGYHEPAHAYYQWVRLQPNQPFRITFAAQPGLSLFLDNQLIFSADSAGSFTLDLSRHLPPAPGAVPRLLGVWQPGLPPDLESFRAAQPPAPSVNKATASLPAAQLRRSAAPGQTVFVGFLLLLGLLYGGVRSAYQPGLARILQVEEVFGSSNNAQSFLTKPAFTLFNLALVVLFALSLALLLTAVHTNLELSLVQRFVAVPRSALVARVLLYTGLISAFVLGKYAFVALLGYIFDVPAPVVNLQYREFLRTMLLGGLVLPLVLLGYLTLSPIWPVAVVAVANASVFALLIVVVLRVARTVHRRASLLTLHLFAYLCATEVLPLAVLLKLIVFSYP